MAIVNRGFEGRRRQPGVGLIPPGQYLVDDFPVLTAGHTPSAPLDDWDFTIVDDRGTVAARWTWEELRSLPAEDITVDIHCVTKWSKPGPGAPPWHPRAPARPPGNRDVAGDAHRDRPRRTAVLHRQEAS